MKKLLYIIVIFALGLTSCNSFLDEDPRSERDRDNAFLYREDGYAAVNVLYRNGILGRYNAGSAYIVPNAIVGGYRSGLIKNDYAGQSRFNTHCYNLTISSSDDNATLADLWSESYKAIVLMANLALDQLPTCPGLSDTERAQLIAETKYFRALNYFFLVKNFGPVPIITKAPAQSLSEITYPNRSSEAKVYEFIIQDLEEALSQGQLEDVPMTSNGYRLSKGSVLALLADVYLTKAGYPIQDASAYAKAADYAKQIVSGGKYPLIVSADQGENSVYNIIRKSDNEKEYLYTVEFDATIANAGWYPTYAFPVGWTSDHKGVIKYDITCATYNPESKLLNVYDQINDLRFQEGQYFHSAYKGISLGGRYPHFFVEEEALDNTAQAGKDRVLYRTAEMYLIFAEADVMAKGTVTAEAKDYLATIQARASKNKTKAQIIAGLDALSKDQFIQEVWREKIREFIFEDKLWYDIIRTRQYPDINSLNISFVNVIGATNPYGKVFAAKDLIYPYPNSEVQRNPHLLDDPIQ